MKRFVSLYVILRRTVMEQRLSMITLGVADLKRAVAFYEKVIGWTAAPPPNIWAGGSDAFVTLMILRS